MSGGGDGYADDQDDGVCDAMRGEDGKVREEDEEGRESGPTNMS